MQNFRIVFQKRPPKLSNQLNAIEDGTILKMTVTVQHYWKSRRVQKELEIKTKSNGNRVPYSESGAVGEIQIFPFQGFS